ncbi:MAG: hypothetical protein ACXW2E_00440 [Nitrososphaeraceae archaeon]
MRLQTLFESREEFVAQQMGDKLVKQYCKELGLQPAAAEYINAIDIVKELAQAGPKYIVWIAKRYINKEFKITEDLNRLKLDLTEFDRVKNQLTIKDINQYKNVRQLYNALEPFADKEVVSNSQLERNIKEGGAIKVFEDSSGSVYKILTKEAACLFGKGTRWCTATTNGLNYFDDYNDNGPLYVIITKPDNEKYQFHFPSGQFMDSSDSSVDLRWLAENFPTLMEVCVRLNLKYLTHNSKSSDKIASAFPFLSKEVQRSLLERDYLLLWNIPKEERTLELCKIAWKKNAAAYLYFPDKFKTLKFSIYTIKRTLGQGIYWADIIPREHIEKVREYFDQMKKFERATKNKKDYIQTLTRLQSRVSEIKPEHKKDFDDLLDEYKEYIKRENVDIKDVKDYMQKIQPEMNKSFR